MQIKDLLKVRISLLLNKKDIITNKKLLILLSVGFTHKHLCENIIIVLATYKLRLVTH